MNAKVNAEKSAVAQAVKVAANKPLPKAAAAKPVTESKPVAKPAVKAASATAAKPVAAKPVTATKTSPKPASKPAAKVVSKPVAKPSAKPVGKVVADKPVVAKVAAKPAKEAKASKPRKIKLVRASYTLPDTEYVALSDLKARITKLGTASKKSELLRAGIALLAKLDDAALKLAVAQVEVIKTGRKAKSK